MRRISIVLLAVFCLFLFACSATEPAATQTPNEVKPSETETTETTAPSETAQLQPDETEESVATDTTSRIIRSSSVHIAQKTAYLAYKERLLGVSVKDDGELLETATILAVLPTIHTVAADEESIYLATNDGIFSLPLSVLPGAGVEDAVLISDRDTSLNSFYLQGDDLYFQFNGSLFSVPKGGGAETVLADDIRSFVVAKDGICCTTSAGELKMIPLQGGSEEVLIDADCGGRPSCSEDTIFVTTGKPEKRLFAFDLQDGQAFDLELETVLSGTHGVWPANGELICQTESGTALAYDLDAHSERDLGTYDLPYAESGTLENGLLYNMSGDALTYLHLDTGKTGSVSIPTLLSVEQQADETQ